MAKPQTLADQLNDLVTEAEKVEPTTADGLDIAQEKRALVAAITMAREKAKLIAKLHA